MHIFQNGPGDFDECDMCVANAATDSCPQDCQGIWGGGVLNDPCGVCGGDGSSCADCAGEPNGLATTDQCSTCDDIPSNDCQKDCRGIWGGGIIEDACQICGGTNATCADCHNVPNGLAVVDRCEACVNPADMCTADCTGLW